MSAYKTRLCTEKDKEEKSPQVIVKKKPGCNIIISLQRGIHGHLTPPPFATPLKFIAIPPIWYASPLQKGARIEQVSLTEWRFSFIPEAGERAIVNVKCFFSKKDFTAGQQTSQKCVITHHHGEITTIKSRCETSSMY